MDELRGTILQSFPEQRVLVVRDEEGKEWMTKGDFEHLYPTDKVLFIGEKSRQKGVGPLFKFQYYREEEHPFRVAKWLRIALGLTPVQIASLLVNKQGMAVYWPYIERRMQFFSLLSFLEQKGISMEGAARLERVFQWKVDHVLEHPFELLTCTELVYEWLEDALYQCGISSHDETRGLHMLESLLKKAHEQGHFYLRFDAVSHWFRKKKIQFKKEWIKGSLLCEGDRIYRRAEYDLEKGIAHTISKRLATFPMPEAEQRVTHWEAEQGFQLANNQRKGVVMALQERFCVITGGPGVGKTTVCKCLTDLLKETKDILMVAPTGRAAKRAQESTGLPAVTIHKLLEYNGVRFQRDKERPIETDALVIDEGSMVDAYLLQALLEAIPETTSIIFVGDVDQLPSVGPGEILRDLIESGVVPVTRLTDVFRQAADSPIITCAYSVNNGELPLLASSEHLKYMMGEDEQEVADQTVMVASSLYREHGLLSVQVLVPMYAGKAGIDALNQRIQHELNPEGEGVRMEGYDLRVSDKVIATQNDDAEAISNGDVGVIESLTPSDIQVRFGDRLVLFPPEKWNTLKLSYVTTVHRAQGSEYPHCVIPLSLGYKRMLQKNLFYTAITRAKQKLWIIYEEEALRKTVQMDSVPRRNTGLTSMLKNAT